MSKHKSEAACKNGLTIGIVLAGCILCSVQYLLPYQEDFTHRPIISMEAFVHKQKLVRQQASHNSTTSSVVTPSSSFPHYYTVFSSSCSPQQHWESFVFFYHAMRVQQPGTVVRIASGCNPEEEREQTEFFKTYIEPMGDFYIHFTPSYSTIHKANGAPYKYMNKPYGLRHWMENSLGLAPNKTASPDVEDSIVILMDPDMILLRPLLHDFTHENMLWVETNPATKIVRHGFPIAQQDGYLTNRWMNLPLNFTKPPDDDGPKHWNSGPPYLATVKDMYRLTIGWTLWVHKVLDVYPRLFAEMYGLIFAGVELNLPFTFTRSIVVSDSGAAPSREGWPFIDALRDEELCNVPKSARMPIALHYCKRYMLGNNFFSKYRLKKNIMDCDKALIRPPPKDVYPRFNYTVNVPLASREDRDTYKEEHTPVRSSQTARRDAFMLCAMTSKVNEALVYLKKHACDGAENINETYSVYDDPTSMR